ncbi:hypothetical protein ACFV42_48160 [Streptomyces solisilvae]|uniref:hypothetical protein n=1 Tax=Streptomyces malaysiensis TaxID=92644 RepID=UPI00368321F9
MVDYILPPPPYVPIPEDIQLLNAVPADADPRLLKIQLLENWMRVFRHESDRTLRELWNDPDFEEADLRAATGLTRMGVIKRADPEYREQINERRRQRRQTPDPPDPGAST